MPVEVRQLIIKATVTSDTNTSAKPPTGDPAQAGQEMIKACIEKIMELIKEKYGR